MAFIRLILDAGLVGIDEIVLSELVGREVGHDNIGTGKDGLFATLWVDGLEVIPLEKK